ncbi:MAG TPA: DUF402 domain-containing protein [Actinomycetota bacterium]|jgi:protein associated with RNAse G/E|nr:DUF402 domain-containing protein [Actinomycetota bacterium]
MKVHCELPKWVEHPHYQFDADLLGRDEYGTWLGCPPGTPFIGPKSPGTWHHAMAILVPDNEWWLVTYQGQGEPQNLEVYVDITTPAEWPSETVCRAIDLDLDVARFRDGRIELLDEDEFEEHRAAFAYPDDVAERALTTAQSVLDAMRERREPFDSAGFRWLEQIT